MRRRQCEAKHGRRHLDPIGSSIRHTQKLHLCKGTSHGRCYSQGGQNPSGMGMGCWEATTQGAERYHKGLTSSLSFVLRYMQCEAQQPIYRLYGDWVPQTRTCSKSQDSVMEILCSFCRALQCRLRLLTEWLYSRVPNLFDPKNSQVYLDPPY